MTIHDRLAAALAGRYRIAREIGRGGMARVYLAHDERHGRDVAIKVLQPDFAAQLPVERFLREIQVVASLTHPQILPLLDSGSIEGGDDAPDQPYFVMPYVSGETLRARMQREDRLGLEETSRIVCEVAEALDFAHGRGVIHRDVKPENILLLEGHAMVSDFGIARAIGAGSTRMTTTGAIMGTPVYMSPEQASGDETIDGRSDQYALACMAYEMLTGKPPFADRNPLALLAAHALVPIPSVRTTRADVPLVTDVAIRRALAKTPADRFATTVAFAYAMRPPTAIPRSPWRRQALVAVGILAIAFLGVAYRTLDVRRSARETARAAAASTRIAVLPLRSVSPDPADRYFADGMTDEIVSSLSNIAGLRVIARSSVAAAGAAAMHSPTDIARALSVGSLLEGSVRKEGNRVRIALALSDPATGESRWTQTYDKTITDVFTIQQDVALAVAGALKVALVGREERQLAKLPTTNAAAYEAYLRATALLGEEQSPNVREALGTAIPLLRSAVRQDSTFALAWAALGDAYTQMIFGFGGNSLVRDSAVSSIARALALDTALAEGYRARSNIEYTREAAWQYGPALQDALHAVLLKPGWADAHATLLSLLAHLGLFDEAMREFRTTIVLDPQNRFVNYRLPRLLWQQQKFAEALATYEAQRRSGLLTSIDEEALVLGYVGRAAEGIALLNLYGSREKGRAGDEAAARAVLTARMGRPAESRALIVKAERQGGAVSHFHHAAFSIATAWALMGDKANAVTWLERTARDGMPAWALFAGDPALKSLRGDPRYEAMMRRLKAECDSYRAIVTASPCSVT